MTVALFIASKNTLTAAIVTSWLESGNSISEVWCENDSSLLQTPRGLSGKVFPQFDTVRVLRNAGIKVRAVPPLHKWNEASEAALATGAEVLVSALTLQWIPMSLIELFPGKAVNFHPALLPRYRGPGPIAGMLIDGAADESGGVTLHLLTEGFDEGPVIAQIACPRSEARDFFDWYFQIATAAGQLAGTELPAYLRGERQLQPQNHAEASYRRMKDGEIDLGSHMMLREIEHRFSAFGPHHAHRWICSNGDKYAVTGVVRVLGERANKPDRRRLLSLDVDLADLRVRLRMRTPVSQALLASARLSAMKRATRRSATKP